MDVKNYYIRYGRLGSLILLFISSLYACNDLDSPYINNNANKQLPSYEKLNDSEMQNLLLPNTNEFVFSMYGIPHNVGQLKELVEVMKKKGLGNGFDPGPMVRRSHQDLYSYLSTVGWPVISYPGCQDFQIFNAPCKHNDGDTEGLHLLEKKGLFSAVHFGEWGSYFHDLSREVSWWKLVYRDDFPKYKHLMKPHDLEGFDIRPETRNQSYEYIKKYFVERKNSLEGRIVSVTGHSHYEAYAAEWGSEIIGIELGVPAYSQSKIAFARGASRQWGIPWAVQISPWLLSSVTSSIQAAEDGTARQGLNSGHSLNFYERMWLHGWFSGAALVTPENSLNYFFKQKMMPWDLTPHGKKAAELFRFMKSHDRGIPYTPVALILDHKAGYNPYERRPWGIHENTIGDIETYDLFENQLFPGSYNIREGMDQSNPEARYLVSTPYGEIFDVLLSSANSDVLGNYPILMLVGDISFSTEFLNELKNALQKGSQLVMHKRHAASIGMNMLDVLKTLGKVEVLDTSDYLSINGKNPELHKYLMRELVYYLPISVEGDAVQYQFNRNKSGWVMKIVNNIGIIKHPDLPVVVDNNEIATVKLRVNSTEMIAKEWRSGDSYSLLSNNHIEIQIQPGNTIFIELKQ